MIVVIGDLLAGLRPKYIRWSAWAINTCFCCESVLHHLLSIKQAGFRQEMKVWNKERNAVDVVYRLRAARVHNKCGGH